MKIYGLFAENMTATATQLPPVRRCLWCKNRIGRERYFLAGDWEHVAFPQAYFYGAECFTDAICPQCFAEVSAELGKPIDEDISKTV